MSDSYEVLLDHAATPDNAEEIALSIREVLVAEGIILPEGNAECVWGGIGFPPGPRVRECYRLGENELNYWDGLRTNGVKFKPERYVNFFGFPVFEYSACPACQSRFPDSHEVMDAIYDGVAAFINDGIILPIHCPECATEVPCDRWITVPDIGLCHVAVEFWNWPTFKAGGWELSIPKLVSERTGRKLVHSWGHM